MATSVSAHLQDAPEAVLRGSCLWAVQAHRAAGHASRLSLVTFGVQAPPGSEGHRPAAAARHAALSTLR